MTVIDPTTLILTSAGVAAFVSSAIALIGQFLERRSRRSELLLAKAIDIAMARTETAVKLAISKGMDIELLDHVVQTEAYYQWLKHLLEHGTLPDDDRIEGRKPPGSGTK